MDKMTSKLISREDIAPGIIFFKLSKPAGFAFEPGQNVDLELINPKETDKDGNKRTMSIASAPDEEDLSFITRVRDTAWKRNISTMSLGEEIQIEGPYGNMIIHSDSMRPAIFIAGGIGITPFISMIRSASSLSLPHKIFLLYSNKRKDGAPLLDELMLHEKKNPNFKMIATMTSDDSWSGEKGRIQKEMIMANVPGFELGVFYLAGSPQMVASMRSMLTELGISRDYIKTEEFAGY